MNRVFIGTSGWVYSHWRGTFYPDDLSEKEWLGFYAKNFDAVELNSSFYHLPKEKTFRGWYERTPKNFTFTVKGSRFITHVKKLKDCEEPLGNLLQAAGSLRDKLGPILFQLPPSFKVNKKRLEGFISLLPEDRRFAFEFRHPSWFSREIYSVLREGRCALVVSDTPDYPCEEVQTAGFMYFRLHGREKLYSSSYSPEQLREYAEKMKSWAKESDVFVFFDNDSEANAVGNAKDLSNLID
jgi:uncharacterized protein YecE (DUF72 family)